MMTLEQIAAERKRLGEMESALLKLDKIRNISRMLSGDTFAILVVDVSNTSSYHPVNISIVLNDDEQRVLAKSAQVALEYARQRIEKEMEGK